MKVKGQNLPRWNRYFTLVWYGKEGQVSFRIIGKVPEGERSKGEKKQESGRSNPEGDQDVMRSKN